MRSSIALALVLSLFCSHVITPAFAAPVTQQSLSPQEIQILVNVQQRDSLVLAEVKAGSDDATQVWAAVGIILFLVLGLAAVVDNHKDDSETSK